MLNDINNFIKWLPVKVFTLNEVLLQELQVFLFFCVKAIFYLVISTLHVI